MPGKRLSMRKIKELLRLRFEVDLSQESIAHSCGLGRTTVREYLQRASRAGVGWPHPRVQGPKRALLPLPRKSPQRDTLLGRGEGLGRYFVLQANCGR